MKKRVDVCLDERDMKQLKEKARELGLNISDYIRKIAQEPIVFLDSNTKTVFKLLGMINEEKSPHKPISS